MPSGTPSASASGTPSRSGTPSTSPSPAPSHVPWAQLLADAVNSAGALRVGTTALAPGLRERLARGAAPRALNATAFSDGALATLLGASAATLPAPLLVDVVEPAAVAVGSNASLALLATLRVESGGAGAGGGAPAAPALTFVAPPRLLRDGVWAATVSAPSAASAGEAPRVAELTLTAVRVRWELVGVPPAALSGDGGAAPGATAHVLTPPACPGTPAPGAAAASAACALAASTLRAGHV
jgi:hypothetical protein